MKSIVQFVNIQEGFLRGLGGDIKDVVTFLGDQLKALFGNSKQALPIIGSRSEFLNEFTYWRLYKTNR